MMYAMHKRSTVNCPDEAIIQSRPNKSYLVVLSKSCRTSVSLPPHSQAGISCWWPSTNTHSLTVNLVWGWARADRKIQKSRKNKNKTTTRPYNDFCKITKSYKIFHLLMPDNMFAHKYQCTKTFFLLLLIKFWLTKSRKCNIWNTYSRRQFRIQGMHSG